MAISEHQPTVCSNCIDLAMLEAMSVLGYGTSYNSREMLRRGQSTYAAELLRAKHEDGRPPEIEQLESLWGDYRTISGEPAYIFAKEAIQMYPDAKVILTVRDDEQKWLRSLEATMWYGNNLLLTRFLRYVDKVHQTMFVFTEPYWKYLFWDDVPNHGIRFYREHNAMVQRMAAGRLLVFNTKQGWDPLCSFLGKDVPSVDFPHVNKTNEHRGLFGAARAKALNGFFKRLMVKGVLPAAVIGLIVGQRARIQSLLLRSGHR